MNDQETHPYQVCIWIPGNGKATSLFERGIWKEMARCITKDRAEEVALCLSLRHPGGVQVAELVSDEHGARFVGYKFLVEIDNPDAPHGGAGDYTHLTRLQGLLHTLSWALTTLPGARLTIDKVIDKGERDATKTIR